MKKYIFSSICMLATALFGLTACTEEDGTTPGGDSAPLATVYTYNVTAPNNPDNDLSLRISANEQTQAVYYKAFDADDINDLNDDAIISRVMSEGTQIELEANNQHGGSYADVLIKDMYGEYLIAVVAAAGSQHSLSKVSFTGLEWEDVVTGTWYYASAIASVFGGESVPTTLQVCTTDKNLYRLKNLFGEGYSMKFMTIDQQREDEDGVYTFLRVPRTITPYEYGDYGAISVQDIGYWQNNDAFVTEGGYESGMYEDHSCFFMIAYCVSAGALGYNFYNFFIPD